MVSPADVAMVHVEILTHPAPDVPFCVLLRSVSPLAPARLDGVAHFLSTLSVSSSSFAWSAVFASDWNPNAMTIDDR